MRFSKFHLIVVVVIGVAFYSGRFLVGATATDESGQIKFEKQLADAKLKLAEANLQRAQAMNKRVGSIVPGDVIREYEQAVEVAKVRVSQVSNGDDPLRFQVWLRQAEALQQVADAEYRNAVAANERAPRAVSESEVQRLRCQSDVATLQVQRGKSLVDQPIAARGQWQLELLDDEVQQLREELMRRPNTQIIYTP